LSSTILFAHEIRLVVIRPVSFFTVAPHLDLNPIDLDIKLIDYIDRQDAFDVATDTHNTENTQIWKLFKIDNPDVEKSNLELEECDLTPEQEWGYLRRVKQSDYAINDNDNDIMPELIEIKPCLEGVSAEDCG
jgi:hypothetical protein